MRSVGKRPPRRRALKDLQVSRMVEETVRAIVQRAGQHLRFPVQYGSEARAEATSESDIDLLALVDSDEPELEKSVRDSVHSVMW